LRPGAQQAERGEPPLVAGITLQIIEGLDHEEEVSKRDVVLPAVGAYLAGFAP